AGGARGLGRADPRAPGNRGQETGRCGPLTGKETAGMRTGWIGAGKVGLPMASHVPRAGHAVRGFDPQPAAVAGFVAAGGEGAGSIAEAARDAEVVVSCLPNDAVLREVATGPGGVLAAMAPGAVFVDTSTVSPGVSQQVAQ